MDFSEGFQHDRGEQQPEAKAARNFGEKIAKETSKKPPIDIAFILKEKYKINLRELMLSDEISAIVDLDTNEINLNIKKPIVHQRFTLAHELGHILLNHKQRRWTDFSSNITSDNPDQPLEVEANAFAAGFLMPKFLLIEQINHISSPKELAKIFKVSEQAMWISINTYRLMNKLKF